MVKLATDHVFTIGAAHLSKGTPCQDYTHAGALPGAAYALVADGCTSGGRTDIGARLLSLATAQALADEWQTSTGNGLDPAALLARIALHEQRTLRQLQPLLGLEAKDLQTTSGLALITEQHGGFLHLRGDGVLVTLDNAGTLRVRRVDWDDNRPYYPVYALGDQSGFIAAHGGDPAALKLHWQEWCAPQGKPLTQVGTGDLSLATGLQGYTWRFSAAEVADLAFVALFTDGVAQVQNMLWTDVVKQLMTFATLPGVFAVRRLTFFLKELQKNKQKSFDDLGYAVIRIMSDPVDVPPEEPIPEVAT